MAKQRSTWLRRGIALLALSLALAGIASLMPANTSSQSAVTLPSNDAKWSTGNGVPTPIPHS